MARGPYPLSYLFRRTGMSNKLRLLVVSVTLLGGGSAGAQTPNYGFPKVPPASEQAANEANRNAPANNPWVVAGAQIGYKFSGNSDFADGLLASSRIALQTLRF